MPHDPDSLLTLVVATLGDKGTLAACLRSLNDQQGAPAFEIIIVDQNEDDRVAALPGLFPNLRIRHERVAFRGASRARNHGAALARGGWLGFPDDDCELRPDALAEFDRIRRGDAKLRIVTGQTVDESGEPNVLRWGAIARAFTPATMFRSVTEATLFVEIRAYASVGGFDERFGPGTRFPAAEGIELVVRLFDACGEDCAYYSPTIKMQHPELLPVRWTRS